MAGPRPGGPRDHDPKSRADAVVPEDQSRIASLGAQARPKRQAELAEHRLVEGREIDHRLLEHRFGRPGRARNTSSATRRSAAGKAA